MVHPQTRTTPSPPPQATTLSSEWTHGSSILSPTSTVPSCLSPRFADETTSLPSLEQDTTLPRLLKTPRTGALCSLVEFIILNERSEMRWMDPVLSPT